MSAPSVVLAGDAVAKMVRAAERAHSVPDLRLAIIGGLAVTCRLGHVHRATGDVDAVVDDVVAWQPTLVRSCSSKPVSQSRIPVRTGYSSTTPSSKSSTPRSCRPTSPTSPRFDRLFVVGYRWALDSAEPLRVVVAASDVDAVLPVAMPAALVATKLHAFCDRQQDEKRASDALDIYRLLEAQDRDGEVAIATNGGPRGLAEVVREVIVERFVDGATRVVRYLKAYGDPAWPEITAVDLRRVVGSFASRLQG